MKRFKMFLEESGMKQKYVSVQYDEETQANLRNWCYLNGFDLSKKYDGTDQHPTDFDFHTTIFYSTSEHYIPNGIQYIHEPIVVWPQNLEYLGENQDVPVINVYCERLLEWRKEFEDKYNMKDQWPAYKPHISLSYNRDSLPNLDKIELPKFTMTLSKLIIEDAT